jgi:hypothetical protein
MKPAPSHGGVADAAALQPSPVRRQEAVAKLRNLLLNGDEEEQRSTFKDLRRALEQDRAGARSPFEPGS